MDIMHVQGIILPLCNRKEGKTDVAVLLALNCFYYPVSFQVRKHLANLEVYF